MSMLCALPCSFLFQICIIITNMKKLEQIRYRQQFLTIGPINHSETVVLATRSKTTSDKDINRYMVKIINFEQQNRHLQSSQLMSYQQDIQSTIGRLQRSNLSIMYKPDYFAFQDNRLYLISQILPLSLQNLLLYHKSINEPFSPWFVHHFSIKMYESINRIKKSNSEFYHKNLKPSNIFIEFRRQGKESEPELQLRLTQFGIVTKHANKFYHPTFQPSIKSKTNISTVSFQYETELYALGIMLIELTTLLSIDDIYRMVVDPKGIEEIKSKIRHYQQKVYRMDNGIVVDFVIGLLENKQGFKDCVERFKQCMVDYTKMLDYKNQKGTVQWSVDRFQKITKDKPYQMISHYFQKAVKQQNMPCDKALRIAQKLDPELYFNFYDYNKLQIFLKNFDIQLKQNQLIELHFAMREASGVNYMEIMKKAYPAQQIMQAIIHTHIKHYDSKKMFFEEKAQRRDFWRAEDITKYLHELGVFLDIREVEKVVQAWTPEHRDSIKYSQFVKVFRSNDEQQTPMKSRMKSEVSDDKKLYDMLNGLRKVIAEDNLNLVNFFRASDFKGKWIVGPEIEKQIKKRITIDEKTFRYCFNQMFEMAGIGTQKKYIHYINLIKFLRIYPEVQLFKMILVQMINNTNRRQFYRKYEKDEKGWNKQSLIDLNQNELLEFGEGELNMIFNELDKDKSKYLSEKQLIYVLTGLEEFDKDFIIQKIKNQAEGKWDLFEVFMRFDTNKDLYLDKPGELAKVFDFIGVNVTAEHCKDLFVSGMRSQKFPYLQFLRNFIPNSKLFLKACMFYIDHFYNGNFQKFYDMGRVKNKKKWSFESFNQINEELLFGFTYTEMGEIWQTLNPEKEESLTKEQVAKIFNCSFQPQQNILGLNTVEKNKQKQSTLSDKKANEQQNNKKNIRQSPIEKKQAKDRNQLAQSLIERKLPEVALCLIKKSRQNGQLPFSTFCQCLDELKIKYLRNVVMKNTSQFQSIEPGRNTMKVNFVNFLMYICQIEEEDKEERKTQCLAIIIKEIMKFENMSSEDVFKKCRKGGVMRLTDYQNFVKDIIKSEVYFDDIEDTWKFWGSPDYITIEEFNKMFNASSFESNLNKKQPSSKLMRQFSFSPQQIAKQVLDDVSSPGFPAPYKQRKQSRDEQQRYPNRQKDREREKQKQKERPSFKRTDSGQVEVPQKGRYQTDKQPKINTLSPRDTKNNYESNRQTQMRKQKEKEEQQKRKQQSKNIALDRFEKKIKQKGSDYLNDLFSKTNAVSFQQFCRCLQDKYGMDPAECQQLNQNFNSFGKVKIQTIKKYIRRIESPEKQKQDLKQPQRDGKKKQPFSMSKKHLSKDKDKQKQKYQKQKQEDNDRYKLEDPRKMKLNIPLIEQHIKILVSSFAKRFDVNEMEPFFFQGNTNINKQDFIKKCVEVNPSISKTMYEKIFLYLKPRANLVSSISFKLSFTYDNQIQIQQAYFPEEIEQEIKAIFDKADKDKSGFIEFQEIQQILNTLGLNQTQKEIQNYFQKIDQNFDKKISLKQFKFFIEDNILPFISDFDEDADNLTGMLKMNDVYRTGYLPVVTVGAVLDRYGVKLGERDLNVLNSSMRNENGQISIKQLIRKLYFPAQQTNSALKALLYRIRWKRKITLKDVQKIFENISASFIMSYTSQVIKNKIVTPSSFITPVLHQSRLFYNDFYYKNMSKLDPKSGNLINFSKPNDLIVEIKLIDAYGIPIPQNAQIKNGILNRSVNVTFYDTSTQEAKDCMLNLQVEFDPDVEDQWVFNKNNRSIFVKIANFEPRKYEKVFLLFQFLVTLVDGQKSIDISCGTASFPIKQLQVEAKTVRKYRLIAGIPNKSRDIDKMSISKRKGWRGFIGSGEVQSEFQIQILPQSKLQDKIQQICVLPQKSIVNRKALSLMWIFREYFAFNSIDQKRVNTDFGNHFIARTFLLCLDIPDVNEELYPFWKDKIEPKTSAIDIARQVFHYLMIDLHIVIHSKQFELLQSYPSKSTFANKTLKSTRKKYLQDVFANIEEWVLDDPRKQYRRRKPYNLESAPFVVEEREMTAQVRHISQQLMKIK